MAAVTHHVVVAFDRASDETLVIHSVTTLASANAAAARAKALAPVYAGTVAVSRSEDLETGETGDTDVIVSFGAVGSAAARLTRRAAGVGRPRPANMLARRAAQNGLHCIFTHIGSVGLSCLSRTGQNSLPGTQSANPSMFDEFGFPRGAELDDISPAHFVYCSRAADGVDDVEVGRIVDSAKRNNLARGITGVLVYGSGVFFQWIEGPSAQMQNLIAGLHGDARHYNIVSLSQGEEQRERLYPNWEMEQVEAENIREVLQDALESADEENNVAALKRIIKHLDAGPLDSLGRT